MMQIVALCMQASPCAVATSTTATPASTCRSNETSHGQWSTSPDSVQKCLDLDLVLGSPSSSVAPKEAPGRLATMNSFSFQAAPDHAEDGQEPGKEVGGSQIQTRATIQPHICVGTALATLRPRQQESRNCRRKRRRGSQPWPLPRTLPMRYGSSCFHVGHGQTRIDVGCCRICHALSENDSMLHSEGPS